MIVCGLASILMLAVSTSTFGGGAAQYSHNRILVVAILSGIGKGGVGTDETGLFFQVSLPEALRSTTLSYKYRFAKGYDWTAGGKLPGLCDVGAVLHLFIAFQ